MSKEAAADVNGVQKLMSTDRGSRVRNVFSRLMPVAVPRRELFRTQHRSESKPEGPEVRAETWS